eukprot:SM000041S15480  [mRNA]  locus=s41:308659:313816:+ [translate_table: standard]
MGGGFSTRSGARPAGASWADAAAAAPAALTSSRFTVEAQTRRSFAADGQAPLLLLRRQLSLSVDLPSRGGPQPSAAPEEDNGALVAVLYTARPLAVGGGVEEIARVELDRRGSGKLAGVVRVPYRFEEHQSLRLELVANVTKLLCCRSETTLGLINSSDLDAQDQLLQVRAEAREVDKANARVTLTLGMLKSSCRADGKKSFLLCLGKLEQDGEVLLYRTERAKGVPELAWQPLDLSLQQLCDADLEKIMVLRLYKLDSQGKSRLSGSAQVPAKKLLTSATSSEDGTVIEFRKEDGNKSGGHFICRKCSLLPQPSFLDFIRAGWGLSLMIGVDFTVSNGTVSAPGTLHYVDPAGKRLNAYQEVMEEFSKVLLPYGTDGQIHAWGFGARLQDKKVSHCFRLGGDSRNVEVNGLDGLREADVGTVRHVALAGPTLLAPLILEATHVAEAARHTKSYACLVIITDGVVVDLEATITAVVNASYLPMSIFIIGLGDASFNRMEVTIMPPFHFADAGAHQVFETKKQKLRTAAGVAAGRAAISFAAMRDHKTVKEVSQRMLMELPAAVLDYMRAKGI